MKTKLITKFVGISVIALAMTGCGGGGSSSGGDTPQADVDASGIWQGTQTINGTDYGLYTLNYKGNTVGFSYDTWTMFGGVYGVTGNSMLVDYKMYDMTDGQFFTDGTITGTVSYQSTINATFVNDSGEQGTINGIFVDQYNDGASLSYLEGNHQDANYDITVTSGKITGTSNGCDISGKITVLDSNVNMYELLYSLSNCSASGTYLGLGAFITDGAKSAFIAGARNDKRMDLIIIPSP